MLKSKMNIKNYNATMSWLSNIINSESFAGRLINIGEAFSEILRRILLLYLVDSKESKELVSDMPFAKRIVLAYSLGLITKSQLDVLNAYRDFRNIAAHGIISMNETERKRIFDGSSRVGIKKTKKNNITKEQKLWLGAMTTMTQLWVLSEEINLNSDFPINRRLTSDLENVMNKFDKFSREYREKNYPKDSANKDLKQKWDEAQEYSKKHGKKLKIGE